MNRCAGCDREADRQIKESNLFLCTPCTKIIPWIKTKGLDNAEPTYCSECDERVWHGEIICRTCLDESLSGFITGGMAAGVLYVLALPIIRFQQGLNAWNQAHTTDDWHYRFYSEGDWHTIDFTELHESQGMMKPLPPPHCSICGVHRSRMYHSDTIPDLILCVDEQHFLGQWMIFNGYGLDHPLAQELIAPEVLAWTKWPTG